MPTVALSPIGNAFQFFDNNGRPLNEGKIYTYAAGTDTPLATYTTIDGNVQNANPIICDASGRLANEIWLIQGNAYDFQLTDSDDNVLGTYEDLSGVNDLGSVSFTNINVSNDGTFGGDVTIDGNLTVGGSSTFDDVLINGNVTWGPSANLSGDVDFDTTGMTLIDYINSVAAGAVSGGTGAVINFGMENKSGSETSTVVMTADAVQAIRPSDSNIHVILSPASQEVNITTAGPVAGGRDQSGAFSANVFIRMYYIWGSGPGIAAISSQQPPSTGPTLPSGYTHWAYAGPFKVDGSVNLYRMLAEGNYFTFLNLADANLLSAGNATVETALDTAPFCPEEATVLVLACGTAITTNGSGNLEFNVNWRLISGINWRNSTYTLLGLSAGVEQNFAGGGVQAVMPNVDQTFYYITTTTTGSGIEHNIGAYGFYVRNGS